MTTGQKLNEKGDKEQALSDQALEQAAGGVGTPRTPAEKFGIINVPDQQESAPSAETYFI